MKQYEKPSNIMKKIHPEMVCPKCGFPIAQYAYRIYCKGKHDLLKDGEPIECPLKTEHMHIECSCGYIWAVNTFDRK